MGFGLDLAQGDNWAGQLGLGDSTDRGDAPNSMGDNLPFVLLGPGRVPAKLVLGDGHTVVLLTTNQVVTFGYNSNGQLGLGSTTDVGSLPGQMGSALVVSDFGGDVQDVAAGDECTCVLLTPAFGSLVKCVVRGRVSVVRVRDGLD